jgi:hypothetical protein
MSVPFKYRQYFRDLFSSFGGKPLSAEDVRFIAARLPPPSFSQTLIDGVLSQCPLDEAGLLKMFGEGQKECGTSYDDLAWGLVEGMSRHNFFSGEEGGDASCDTKELRAVLDSKIRPVRLDVNAIFSTNTAGGERTTIAELMLVFRAIFPANQTNFAELFSWARASRPAPRRPRPSEAAVVAATDSHTAEASTSSVSAAAVKEAPTAAPETPAVDVSSVSPVAESHAIDAAAASPSVDRGASGFSNVRERFGSFAKTKPPQVYEPAASPRPAEPSIGRSALRDQSASRHHDEEHSLAMESSFGSPAPPPPPPDEQADDDVKSNASSAHGENDTTNPFAAIANQSSRRQSSPQQPTVVVTPPAALKQSTAPAPTQPPAVPQPAQQHQQQQQQQPDQRQQSPSPPQQQQQPQEQQQSSTFALREPPPLPASVRSAVQSFSYQQAQQQQVEASNNRNGPSPTEVLSLRQVQQLPPEVVDFIQQLDRQRSQFQTQLERELNDLTENQQLIRLFGDRLAALQSLQETPAFKPLEKERGDLIHKMEQWIHCTRAGKEAARTELAGLRRSHAADAAAHSVYRSSVLYNRDAPSTTVTSQPAGTAAATAALAALHDPTPRLARFFENLSNKEKEIKAQEAAVDKLKQLERRERRLLAEINASSSSSAQRGDARAPSSGSAAYAPLHSEHASHQQTYQQHAPHHALRQQQQQPANAGGRVFRMDPSILQDGKPSHSKVPAGGAVGGVAVPQQDLYFNFWQQHRAPPPAATLLGVSRDNPYLSKNIADRHRTSMESGNNVTRRLEDYLGAASQQQRK